MLGFSTPYTVSYGYHVNADSTKTALLSSYKNSTDTPYSYAYDANGNITEITKGTASASYVYDKANQLIRENDGFSNKTWTYSYDRFGNMLEKAEYAYTTGTLGTPVQTIAYTYSTGEWKDQLTGYNGQAITYDAMGNPTSYLGSALSWTDGRKLESFGSTASYVYSREGMRIQKTAGNTVTNYHYNGSLLMAETSGNSSQYYSYDANGNLIALYYNNTYYYYLRNGQGDIVGLLDNTGASVVAYTYDAWGKALSVTGTLASTLGIANPFRYRGYYYDTETQLYYLQSRYYDPAVCRFLNGDVLMSTGQGIIGCNMFGYCNNNPSTLQDSHGTIATFNTKMTDGGGGSRTTPKPTPALPKPTPAPGPSPVIPGYDATQERQSKGRFIEGEELMVRDYMKNNKSCFYRGTLVIRQTVTGTCAIGKIIWLKTNEIIYLEPSDIKHEYGHTRQEWLLTLGLYVPHIAVPSVINFFLEPSNYYDFPWEKGADWHGGVNRTP